MRNETRLAYNAYVQAIQQLNNIPDATVKFVVDPSVQQTLEDRMTETSEFLQRVNIIGVNEQQGVKLGLGVGSPIASTTDTSQQDRSPVDVSDLDPNGYICTQTNSDTQITYAKLDAWAKFKDFQVRIRNAIIRRQALDRICIGFNGTSRAATSDREQYPLLQDVNKGWLQKYREQAQARVMSEGAHDGAVTIGEGGDYKNLDALVYDALTSLVEPWYQDDTELVVVCGRGLLRDKYFPILNTTQPPTEQQAADMIVSQKRIGGLRGVQVPYFPANTFMIQRLDHLSIYWQEGGRRRTIVDNAKRDRIENYESSNDAYVVEDFGSGCVVENILSPAAAGEGA